MPDSSSLLPSLLGISLLLSCGNAQADPSTISASSSSSLFSASLAWLTKNAPLFLSLLIVSLVSLLIALVDSANSKEQRVRPSLHLLFIVAAFLVIPFDTLSNASASQPLINISAVINLVIGFSCYFIASRVVPALLTFLASLLASKAPEQAPQQINATPVIKDEPVEFYPVINNKADPEEEEKAKEAVIRTPTKDSKSPSKPKSTGRKRKTEAERLLEEAQSFYDSLEGKRPPLLSRAQKKKLELEELEREEAEKRNAAAPSSPSAPTFSSSSSSASADASSSSSQAKDTLSSCLWGLTVLWFVAEAALVFFSLGLGLQSSFASSSSTLFGSIKLLGALFVVYAFVPSILHSLEVMAVNKSVRYPLISVLCAVPAVVLFVGHVLVAQLLLQFVSGILLAVVVRDM
eukprot:GILI01014043.1.p1 GENE.GILI01014043.1~~GILI01014043.1.p1  ORF type:complete len:406 (+),score=134.86 GILI01014043.1:60-1277(+)